MEEEKTEARIWQAITIIVVILAFAQTQALCSHLRHLYDTALEQGQYIETLLQAENDRLESKLVHRLEPQLRQPREQSPTFIFKPIANTLPEELQQFAWDECKKYDTLLSQQELFELVMKVMWNESRCQVNVPDNYNVNGSVDRGPMQINSVNWTWLAAEGIDINQPEGNIKAGIKILAGFLNDYQDLEYALTAYGNGPTGAQRLGGTSDFALKIINLDLKEVASGE